MGVRNVTNTTNERTAVGAVFPLSAVGNSLPVWTTSAVAATIFSALLSSYVCDFAARLKMGGINLNFFIAKQIPVLHPTYSTNRRPGAYPGSRCETGYCTVFSN